MTGLEAAAERRGPFPHAGDARSVADPGGVVGHHPGGIRADGVGDLDQDGVGSVADPYRHRSPGGVAGDVGEGFLDDPVGRQVGGGGQRHLRSGRFDGDVESWPG
jgi:hypothetical protein